MKKLFFSCYLSLGELPPSAEHAAGESTPAAIDSENMEDTLLTSFPHWIGAAFSFISTSLH